MRSMRVAASRGPSLHSCALARQEASPPRVTLSKGLVMNGIPRLPKPCLKNWHVNDAVCESGGHAGRCPCGAVGTSTLTDVLIAGMRLGE